MRALIDADIVIYEMASTCERSIPWPFGEDGDVMWTRHVQMEEAWVRTLDALQGLTSKVNAKDFIAAITTSAFNWRFTVYPAYKSNRSKGVKPMAVAPIRERIAKETWGRLMPPLEGDDILGIMQTKPGAGDTIIVSTDKDMQTIPGLHYNPGKDIFFEQTVGQANAYHLRQTLSGDTTDGYPGCPGIGDKKALNLIPESVEDHEVAAAWKDIIVPAFNKAERNEEFALAQARVARILRASDYNPKTREVILWDPNR